jgi:ABC-type amino acid transport substrate-binding protein
MLTVVAVAVLAAAVGPGAGDLAEVQKSGVLRVLAVVVEDEPEFFSLKAGGAPGLDHEILDGFVRLHKLKLEVVRIDSWDALIPALNKGRGDVIAGRFTATEARRKLIDFSVEVFPTRNVVVTRKPHRAVASLEDLAGDKIGVVKGSSLAEAVAQARLTGVTVDDGIPSGGALTALRSGRITATVDELAGAMISRRRDPDLQIGMFLGGRDSYAYGVRRGDDGLRKNLDDYLENLRRTPTWNRLVVKYFGDSAPEILKKARALGP